MRDLDTSYTMRALKMLGRILHDVRQAKEAERPIVEAEGEQPRSTQEARLAPTRRVDRETC